MDPVELLQSIRGATFKFQPQRYTELAITDAVKKLIFFFQTKEMSDSVFFEQFENLVLVIEQYGGSVCMHPALVEQALKRINPSLTANSATSSQYLSAKVEATDRFMAALMLLQVDRSRYGSM
eukprot:1621925-Ditylum_brightwellii.AAC.1